jgi:hypothetical protein
MSAIQLLNIAAVVSAFSCSAIYFHQNNKGAFLWALVAGLSFAADLGRNL